jgi:transcriptional regulator with XRE-family HTH domain
MTTRLRALREAQGLTISGLSCRTGLNASNLSMLERRRLAPSLRVKRALSEFYRREVHELFDAGGLAI